MLDYVAQDNQYDIDFLLPRGAQDRLRRLRRQEPQRARPRPRRAATSARPNARQPGVPDVTYELKWGISLIDFTPKLSTANQVKSVEVRSWDRADQPRDPQEGRPSTHPDDRGQPRPAAPRRCSGQRGCDGCSRAKRSSSTSRSSPPEQAERRAIALLSDRLKQLVEATGTTVGLPDLRAGQRVRIVGLGARFSGTYFVTKTTHTINDSGYVHQVHRAPRAGRGATA